MGDQTGASGAPKPSAESFSELLELVRGRSCVCKVASHISSYKLVDFINEDYHRRSELLMAAAKVGHFDCLTLLLAGGLELGDKELVTGPCELRRDIPPEVTGSARTRMKRQLSRQHHRRIQPVFGKIKCSLFFLDSHGRNIFHWIASEAAHLVQEFWTWLESIDGIWRHLNHHMIKCDKSGDSPVMIYVQQDYDMICNLFLDKYALSLVWGKPKAEDHFKSVLGVAGPQAKKRLVALMIDIEMSQFWRSTPGFPWEERWRDEKNTDETEQFDLDEVKIQAARLDWFPLSDEIELNQSAQDTLRDVLRAACSVGELQLVQWLIDEWKVQFPAPLKDADLAGNFSEISLTDSAVLGDLDFVRHARLHVPKYSNWIDCNRYESFLGMPNFTRRRVARCKRDQKQEEDSILKSEVHNAEMFVNISFIGTSVGLLRNCIDEKLGNSEKDEKFPSAEDMAIYFEAMAKKGDPEGRRHSESSYWWSARAKKCRQHRHKERINVIEHFVSQSLRNVPRLDLIVLCDAVQILEWLVTNNYVDIDEKISDFLLEKEDLGPDFEVPDDTSVGEIVCPICYCDYTGRQPTTLECGHTFCLACLQDVFRHRIAENKRQKIRLLAGIKCPMCRSDVERTMIGNVVTHPLPVRDFVCAIRDNRLPAFAGSMDISEDWTVAHLLFMTGACAGSLNIIEYLISKHSVRPEYVHTATGHNAVRLAVSQRQYFVVDWFLRKGFTDLATELSPFAIVAKREDYARIEHVKINAIHAVARAGDTFALNLLEHHGLLELNVKFLDSHGSFWMAHAVKSGDEGTIAWVESWQQEHRGDEILQMIQDDCSCFKIKKALLDGKFVKKGQQWSLIADNAHGRRMLNILHAILIHGRVDILRWMFLLCMWDFYRPIACRKFYYPVMRYCGAWMILDARSAPEFLLNNPRKVVALCADEEKRTEMIDFFDTVDRMDQACVELAQFQNDCLNKLFDKGAPVEDILEMCRRYDETLINLLKDLPTEFKRVIKYKQGECDKLIRGDIQGELDKLIGNDCCFQIAVRRKHFHLASWVADRYYTTDQLTEAFDRAQDNAMSDGLLEEFEWLFDFKQQTKLSDGARCQDSGSLLFEAARIVAGGVMDAESDKRSKEELVEVQLNRLQILTLLLKQPEANTHVKNLGLTRGWHEGWILFYTFGRLFERFECGHKDISFYPEHVCPLAILKLLVEHGADVHAKFKKNNIVDHLTASSTSWERPFRWQRKFIHYLVYDMKVSISHWPRHKRDILKPSDDERRELAARAAEARAAA